MKQQQAGAVTCYPNFLRETEEYLTALKMSTKVTGEMCMRKLNEYSCYCDIFVLLIFIYNLHEKTSY